MAKRTTVYDVEDSLRAAGLVQVGGGARNTYYGLPGQKVGVGYFIKLMPKKLAMVERIRGQYGRKLEDVTHDSHFYGSLRKDEPGVYSIGETLRGWLERRAEGTSRKKEFDALSQEYLRRFRRGGSISSEELRDLAVAYKAAHEGGYKVQQTFDIALLWADEISDHGGEVTREAYWEGPGERRAAFIIEDLLERMARS